MLFSLINSKYKTEEIVNFTNLILQNKQIEKK